MTIRNKIFIFVSFIIISISLFIISVMYSSEKSLIETNFQKNNQKNREFLISTLQKNLLLNQEEVINNILDITLNTTNIKYIRIYFENYLFTKEGLIKNSIYPQYSNWNVNDISVDARIGYVNIEPNNYYKLNNSVNFNPKEPLSLKFFLYKDDKTLNAISKLNFFYEKAREGFDLKSIDKNLISSSNIYFFDKRLARLDYMIDDSTLENKLSKLYDDYLLYSVIAFLLILVIIYLIYYYFSKSVTLKNVIMFKKYLKEVLDTNMSSKPMEKSGDANIDESIDLLSKILKKYSAVLSELNINKDILERKVFTDDLTGLPNQKVFELDLKNMFILGSSGYIGLIKLDCLGSFTKDNGSALANHLIEEFSNTVQNKFSEHGFSKSTFYRFFGSEFAIIIKDESEDKVKDYCNDLEEEFNEVKERYEIKDKLAYYSFIPFDKYGTINSILQSMTESYNKVKDSGETFNIVNSSEVLDKFLLLEQNVRDIISNNSFEITFGLDTKSNGFGEKTIMREVIPIIYDENHERFQIGTFISICEKIDMAIDFDKLVIQKVVQYIKSSEINHVIAINLSLFSLRDKEFINWLHALLILDKDITKYLVFSLTSYNVSTNIEVFKNFVSEVHRFGAKVILKRYSSNDFTLDELKSFKLDYLRISKDYTTSVSNDRDKKHFLRSIVNFGQANNTLILGDNIKDASDLEICFAMGIDGNSSY